MYLGISRKNFSIGIGRLIDGDLFISDDEWSYGFFVQVYNWEFSIEFGRNLERY
ncbi:MAG: hypothetical protein AABY22_30160 [Nanoarchaeota archaeon]